MSRSDRRSHIRQQVRRLQMRSQSFTFCIISQSPATLFFRYMYFAYHLCPFFGEGSSIGISCKQVKTRFASFPCYRDSRQGLAQARTLARCPQKAAAFSDILSRKCCCFLFLQMISFSKRSAKSEFFLHSQIQDRLHQRDPALPANFCLQISRRCS